MRLFVFTLAKAYKKELLQNLGKVSNSLYLLFERSQATQSGLRKRKAPERRRTELNGVNGDIVCGKVFRPPLSAPQLSRALRREHSACHIPAPSSTANNRVSLRDERKKYTQSSIHIALSRPEPIEKSVQGRCRAVCPAQGFKGGMKSTLAHRTDVSA